MQSVSSVNRSVSIGGGNRRDRPVSVDKRIRSRLQELILRRQTLHLFRLRRHPLTQDLRSKVEVRLRYMRYLLREA